MEYQIALSPELDVEPENLVDAWNETPECRAVAQARLSQPSSAQYDPTVLSVVLTVFSGIAGGIASNILYDMIKERLAEQGVRKQTQIVEMEHPDGSRLLVITITED
jgi:hypothetical protein